eukprot:2647420-Rhodomonas_salina.1
MGRLPAHQKVWLLVANTAQIPLHCQAAVYGKARFADTFCRLGLPANVQKFDSLQYKLNNDIIATSQRF